MNCSWCEDSGEPCACNAGGLRVSFNAPLVLLVCGSRNFSNRELIKWWLDSLLVPGDTVRHGAATGADSIAAELAQGMEGVTVSAFPADWTKGRGAGVARSREMLVADGGSDLVLAFPGTGRGTFHTMRMAEELGIKVMVGNSPTAMRDFEIHRMNTTQQEEKRHG